MSEFENVREVRVITHEDAWTTPQVTLVFDGDVGTEVFMRFLEWIHTQTDCPMSIGGSGLTLAKFRFEREQDSLEL